MRRMPVSLTLLLACALAVEPVAFAQTRGRPRPPTVREQLPDAARREWDAARELFDAQDYQGALVEYLRAYELSKNPRVLYNVGICEKNLRRYARALARFQQQLAEGAGKLSPEEEQNVKEAIAAIEPFVSTIEVTSNEPGAMLYIDGLEAGQTPFAGPIPIDVGPHQLRLHKPGFQDATQNVAIAGNAGAKVNFKLEPLVKTALVTVNVVGAPQAHVVVDGVDMGLAPFKGEVGAGRHTFEARAPGYVTARQTSEVRYKEPLEITLSLSAERHEARVRIVAKPEGATIEIDGKVVGSTTWEGVLPSGGHQLVVRKPGYDTYSTELALNDDQTRSVTVDLKPQRDSSWILWAAGTVAVVAGGAVASYFVFRPADPVPVTGTLNPGVVVANYPRF